MIATQTLVQTQTQTQSQVPVSPIDPSTLQFNQTKTRNALFTKQESPEPFQKEYLFLNTKKDMTSSQRIKSKTFLNTFTTLSQSGYQSKKELETEVVGQDKKYVNIKSDSKPIKGTNIDAKTINKFKRTFRSGNQVEATDKLDTLEELILMGATNPTLVKNKGLLGDTNGANGQNGWQRQKLLVATYVDSAGDNISS